MAKLTYEERNALPRTIFALKMAGKYPIPDISHARNALARVSSFGSPGEQLQVKYAVYQHYPELKPRDVDINLLKSQLMPEEPAVNIKNEAGNQPTKVNDYLGKAMAQNNRPIINPPNFIESRTAYLQPLTGTAIRNLRTSVVKPVNTSSNPIYVTKMGRGTVISRQPIRSKRRRR
jgi:hypothetical protein